MGKIDFDPAHGFIITDDNYESLLGTYMCLAVNYRSFQVFVKPQKGI